MKHFTLTIHWRGMVWHLNAIARSSVDLLTGMLDHCPQDARVSVRAHR